MKCRVLWIALFLAVAGCGGGGGGSDDDGGNGGSSGPAPSALDEDLGEMTGVKGLTGDPASPRGLTQTPPDDDPLVKLGQILFFSQTLGGGYDVSCGTCHHPDFAGSDGLSIGVGVVPQDAAAVGPGRLVDASRDRDAQADGGPNMHRNSITTFNSALFDRALMYDGRVSVLDDETATGGHGQRIRTPESGQAEDLADVDGLMEHTMKGPIVNDNEMRGFLYTNLPTPVEYRQHLVARLIGEVDTQYNEKDDSVDNWLDLFRDAFGITGSVTASDMITMLRIQRAMAAYIESQIFVDTPWRDYMNGDMDAIGEDAKKGAMLFLESPDSGGLGCASCHSGDRFTDESFRNVGFPQIGRGFGRADNQDLGRWTETRRDEDLDAFRVPTLLNVAETAPYGHAGSFDTLEETIRYHADPRSQVDFYDFSLQHLNQFLGSGVTYPHAEEHTRTAIGRPNFAEAEALLPARTLTETEVRQVTAFLESLTDRCVADEDCISQWTPAPADDPDGNLLVRNQSESHPGEIDAESPDDYPALIPLNLPPLAPRATFADVEACENRLGEAINTGQTVFVRRDTETSFGLNDGHGYSVETWFGPQQSTLEIAMVGGGVSATYLNDDCWPDLVFSGGNTSGMRFYRNVAGSFFEDADLLAGTPEREFTGAAFADLNGDYRRELLFGNVKPGEVPVYTSNGAGQYQKAAALPMTRPTFGISFAPLDESGYPYLFLAHWGMGTGTNGASPALWKNEGDLLRHWDSQANTSTAFIDQRFNFTPKFADFTGDGRLDLVAASDFGTSAALRNEPDGQGGSRFVNETDRDVIIDENGMGSTLLDIDNDGNLEWFVTSIFDNGAPGNGNWSQIGNRLYRNASTADRIVFEDITEEAGVDHGYWGWGACAADFDNDGFVDIFHVNGFGDIPEAVVTDDRSAELDETYEAAMAQKFYDKPPRLFINNGNGGFDEQAAEWDIDVPSDGRGLTCFDRDRDGDIDIALLDHSTGLQFFENQSGSDTGRHFLNIRLVGESPNTDAIGARVHVTANIGNGHGEQTMLRLSEANSNFNSQNPPDLHFGLGEAATADIRVLWPGGTVTIVDRTRVVSPAGAELVCEDVVVNQFLVLDQRDGANACPAASE